MSGNRFVCIEALRFGRITFRPAVGSWKRRLCVDLFRTFWTNFLSKPFSSHLVTAFPAPCFQDLEAKADPLQQNRFGCSVAHWLSQAWDVRCYGVMGDALRLETVRVCAE